MTQPGSWRAGAVLTPAVVAATAAAPALRVRRGSRGRATRGPLGGHGRFPGLESPAAGTLSGDRRLWGVRGGEAARPYPCSRTRLSSRLRTPDRDYPRDSSSPPSLADARREAWPGAGASGASRGGGAWVMGWVGISEAWRRGSAPAMEENGRDWARSHRLDEGRNEEGSESAPDLH